MYVTRAHLFVFVSIENTPPISSHEKHLKTTVEFLTSIICEGISMHEHRAQEFGGYKIVYWVKVLADKPYSFNSIA